MTCDELITEKLWQETSRPARMLFSRQSLKKLAAICVRRCPVAFLATSQEGSEKGRHVTNQWKLAAVSDARAEFGPLFWILLAPFVHWIITRLLDYWWQSRINRSLISEWRINVR